MIKGSEVRKPDHQIESLLLDRWSPRAMSGEEISQEELMRLFEAARWAPSSFNAQQWRALYVRRGTEHWQTFFDLLVDANKVWAKNAAVRMTLERRGKTSRCKVSTRVWWSMGWKDSITSAHAKNFESLMSFKSKRWPQSANRGQRNGCLKSCRPGKVRMIGANFPIAFSKDRLGPDRNYSQRHSPDQPK